MDAENELDLFVCRVEKSDQIPLKLHLDVSCYLPNAYSKSQIDQ